ncbi:CDP-alcohol phosphatidyltransferase family protein [Hymenobacter properus]|uniref:CDP-alcohol phosphatidyltransferase family protein n=1 Tax=Hymenobacter properus TaxID=2791026 RepID=A0A931BC14_9BACT|nr:CDP-alcohol phosphatidyltransferase family protein [Hymenobacter properus]MBF9140994.1 CDP-alcohol phosphatidyltransferase family protein [Hymenobacter properus]MBR7719803.1 CDP-alcohol phosphatidyltransferase family protein [Microvirga sp. SRT04]
MKQVPLLLIYSRLVIGGALLVLSYQAVAHFAALAVGLLALGVLTDVFDGIVARHLSLSTEKLRRLDSAVDQIFWVLVLGATYLAWPGFFARHTAQLWLLVLLEGLTYAVSLLRFRKEVATHSWGAKAWVLVSLAALIQLLTTGDAGWLFQASFGIGVASRLEIVVIVLLLRRWTNDVPTAYHAWQLRRGRPIRRYKLLNG